MKHTKETLYEVSRVINLFKYRNGENLTNWHLAEILEEIFPYWFPTKGPAFVKRIQRILDIGVEMGWIEKEIKPYYENGRWKSVRFVYILDYEYLRYIQQFKILKEKIKKTFAFYGPVSKVPVGGGRFIDAALPTDICKKNQKWYTELRPLYVSGKIVHLAIHNVDNLELRPGERGAVWDAPRKVQALLKEYKDEVLRGE